MSNARFLPGLSSKLFGSAAKSESSVLRDEMRKIGSSSLSELSAIFENWIPGSLVESELRRTGERERLYTSHATFWAFLSQARSPSTSCREAVRLLQARVVESGEAAPSSSDSAYCQARGKLNADGLERINRSVCSRIAASSPGSGRWMGREVKVIGGTGISMPDTQSNQREYPQSSTQKTGCGFPMIKLVGSFSLGTGAMEDWLEMPLRRHESKCLPKLMGLFGEGDVALTDRGFSSFSNIASLAAKGCDAVMRAHQARKIDLRKGNALGPMDRLSAWSKPQRPKGYDEERWAELPARR